MTTNATTPFQWLQECDRRAKQRAKGLPRREKIQQIWRGIAFRLGTHHLVTSITNIQNIKTLPDTLAKVPGAKEWVKGIANIGGVLLPIIDLHDCLSDQKLNISKKTRLLIVSQTNISAGLIVDEVLGIKHFPEHLYDQDKPCEQAWLAPFVKGTFYYEQQTWTVFEMANLLESDIFRKAAM